MPILNCRVYTAFPILVLLALGPFAAAQAPTPEPAAAAQAPPAEAAAPGPAAAAGISTGPALATLRPALNQVSAAVANLKIPHWKAPGDIRSTSLEDVASIQHDLGVTLPPMLDQAESAPNALLAPSFAVFRNIDALYDVLLRITEMANLAGSAAEARRLEDARAALESARAHLADSLLASVTAQDAQIARLRAEVIAAAKAPPPPPPTKIVVDDGPEAPKVKRRRRKPAPKPAAAPAQQTTPPQ